MFAEELIKRLRPLIGSKADEIWNSYLASDAEERKVIQHSLENFHSQVVDDYRREKLVLTPPHGFEQLGGDYQVGTVYYADKPLYPFSLAEKELVQHIGVFGRTGAGKSCFVRNVLLALRKPFLVFDWKGTYSDLGVILFEPGSSSFRFNPLSLAGIDPGHRKTYIREVVELFIDSYLGNLQLLTVKGVEFLLLRAIDALAAQGKLTFRNLYHWVESFEGKMREMDWKTSALNVLYKLVTGPLGRVMAEPSLGIEQLVQQSVILELSNIGSSKDKSFFVRSFLLRLYYHFRNQEPSQSLRLLVVIEEAHNILLKKSSGRETIIELLLRQVREYGVGICVVDQHPSLMSLPALGTYCTVSFNLKLREDRDAMASALNLEQTEYLGRLPSRFAIVKLADRFQAPFVIRTLDTAQLGALLPYQKVGFTAEKGVFRVSFSDLGAERPPRNLDKEEERGAAARHRVIDERGVSPKGFSKVSTEKFTDEELLLCHVYAFPLKATGERYADLGWRWDRGTAVRRSLQDRVQQESVPTHNARIKRIALTQKGCDWLCRRGFTAGQGKLVGVFHGYWQRRLRDQFERRGYAARIESPLGRGAVDLLVSKGKRCVAVEIETGTNSYNHILGNIAKCQKFDGVVSFILNKKKAREVEKQVGDGVVVADESECIWQVERLFRQTRHTRR